MIVIKRTDGGVTILTLAEGANLDQCLGPWKEANPGLYLGHREMPDEALPADRSFRDAWCDVTPDLKIDIDVDKAKAIKLAEINAAFEGAAAQLKVGYPPSEIESWPIQEREAMAWHEDSTASTPWVDALAAGRGVERTTLLSRIVDNVAAFRAASAFLVGKRQRLEDAVNAVQPSPKAIDVLTGIAW